MKLIPCSAPLTVAQACEPIVHDAGLCVVRGIPAGAYSTIFALHDDGTHYATVECRTALAEREALRRLPDQMARVVPGTYDEPTLSRREKTRVR